MERFSSHRGRERPEDVIRRRNGFRMRRENKRIVIHPGSRTPISDGKDGALALALTRRRFCKDPVNLRLAKCAANLFPLHCTLM